MSGPAWRGPLFSQIALTGMLVAVLYGVSAFAETRSAYERSFEGAWEADVGFARWAIIRRADHTFSESRLEIRDYAIHKATRVRARGKWSIRGNYYIKHYLEVSDAAWQPLVDRDLRAKIIRVTPAMIDYRAKDGPPTRERRVGGQDIELRRIAPSTLGASFKDYIPSE